MFRLSTVSKSFGEVVVLRDVSIDFSAAQITAVVGPNGAGKTTLLNLASGIGSPTSGFVSLNAQDITSRGPAYHREVGIIRTFQEPRVFAELSVLENIRFSEPATVLRTLGAALGLNRRRGKTWNASDQTLSLLDEFGLGSKHHTSCSRLSYGQRRLVELVTAIASSGVVYLFDEPSTGIAQNLQAIASAQIKSLASRGAIVVVVDHDIEFVRDLADVMVFLDQGRIISRGSTADVLGDPKVRGRLWGAWHK